MGALVPRRNQELDTAVQMGEAVVYGLALNRIRIEGMQRTINDLVDLGDLAIDRLVGLDIKAARAIEARPEIEEHVMLVQQTVTFRITELFKGVGG